MQFLQNMCPHPSTCTRLASLPPSAWPSLTFVKSAQSSSVKHMVQGVWISDVGRSRLHKASELGGVARFNHFVVHACERGDELLGAVWLS